MSTWRKSSYSNGSSACIYVRETSGGKILIVESEDESKWVWTSRVNFAAFIAGVKAGEFDDLAADVVGELG